MVNPSILKRLDELRTGKDKYTQEMDDFIWYGRKFPPVPWDVLAEEFKHCFPGASGSATALRRRYKVIVNAKEKEKTN